MNETEVVIDTNIFISAVIGKTKSIPKTIIDALYERKFSLIISLPLIRELKETLRDPKFKGLIKEDEAKILVEFIKNEAKIIQPTQKINIARDPKDNVILECAVASHPKPSFIVTGDKDILALKRYQHIPIITPKEFLKKLP